MVGADQPVLARRAQDTLLLKLAWLRPYYSLHERECQSKAAPPAMKMTSRERIEAALKHREPDRTPVFEYILLTPWVDGLLGRKYAWGPGNWEPLVRERGWQDAVAQLAVDRLDLAEFFGHDMLNVKPNPPSSGDRADANPAIVRGAIGLSDDPVEAVRQSNERWEANLQQTPPEECFLIYRLLKEEMRKREIDLPILAPAYEHGVWTDTALMQTMVLDPGTAHQHFTLATRKALGLIEVYASLELDQVGIGGDFAGNQPLISPQHYRQFIAPEVTALSRAIHQAGMASINASDGYLWPVIEDFLLECKVDGYLEIDTHAGMDLSRLKKRFGDRTTFYGNLDCGNVLSFSSAEQICRHVEECLTAGMGNGGHILCAGNAITASVPIENYFAMLNAYRRFFGLDELGL